MRHTLRFRACDDGSVLFEEHTLAYGLVCGYERGAAELGVVVGRPVRMELLDDAGRLLDWRIYVASVTGGQFPSVLPAAREDAVGVGLVPYRQDQHWCEVEQRTVATDSGRMRRWSGGFT